LRTCISELRALGLLKPHAEHVPIAVEGDAEREVERAALHGAAVADLQDHAVQEYDRVDVLQRPLGPIADVVHHTVGHPADQVTTDADTVDLLQVRGDIARGESAAVEREDLVVEPLKAALALANDLRLKAPVTIARRVDPDLPMLGDQRLGGRPVACVPRPSGRLLMRLIAQVVGDLDLHRALHQPLGQLGQQPAGAGDLLLGARAGEELVDHLIADPSVLGHPERSMHPPPVRRTLDRIIDHLLRGDPGGAAAGLPSADLRSLYELAAIVAGQPRRDPWLKAFKLPAALHLGGPAVQRSGSRWHDDLFRSCLHTSWDRPVTTTRSC